MSRRRLSIYVILTSLITMLVSALVGYLFWFNSLFIANSTIDLLNVFLPNDLKHVTTNGFYLDFLPSFNINLINTEVFLYQLKALGVYLVNSSHWLLTMSTTLDVLIVLFRISLFLTIFLLIFKLYTFIYFRPKADRSFNFGNNGVEFSSTLPYRFFKRLHQVLRLRKVKDEVRGFFHYYVNVKAVRIIFVLLVLYIINAYPVFMSFAAIYLGLFVADFKQLLYIFPRIFNYIIPLFIYMWPVMLVLILVYGAISVVKFAYRILEKREGKNEESVCSFGLMNDVVGPPGDSKTLLITDFIQTFPNAIRKTLLKTLNKMATMFPNFPFAVLEEVIISNKNNGKLRNRAEISLYMKALEFMFNNPKLRVVFNNGVPIMNNGNFVTRKRCSKNRKPFIFGYDYLNEKMEFYDGLRVISLWTAINTYAQAYFVYSQPVPLALTNYPVSLDLVNLPTKHFVKFDYSFFNKKYKDVKNWATRKMSMITDYDNFRFGKRFTNNPISFLDCCAIGWTEFDKERGNKNDHTGLSKNDEVVNQLSDLMQDFLKIERHLGTIDFEPLVKNFCDMQSSSDIQARIRHLFDTIITIKKDDGFKCVLPLNYLFLPFCKFILKKINKFKDKHRDNRRDKTLLGALAGHVSAFLYKIVTITENTFNSRCFELTLNHGSEDKETEPRKVKYYIQTKKIFSDRYPTDVYKGLIDEASRNNRTSFYESKQFSGLYPNVEELLHQNSFWSNSLVNGVLGQLNSDVCAASELLETRLEVPAMNTQTAENSERTALL